MTRAALAALTVALISGCGGTPPSLAQLRRQAARICNRTDRTVARIPSPHSATETSPKQATAFLTAGIARLENELGQLHRLSPTSDVAPVYRAGVDALSDQLTALRGAAAAIRLGQDPARAFQDLQHTLAPLETQANNAWAALQIAACVNA